MNAAADLIRKYFAAYESKDRKLLEGLLSDDFTFSSPLDDHIHRELYFERCWPNSENHWAFHIEKLFVEGDEAFVTYECERTDGARFRNAEFFETQDGKIREVTVYFGSDTASGIGEEEIRALIEATAKACRAKDVKALMACYAADVIAFDLLPPLRYQNAAEVGKRAAAWFDSFQGPIGYDVRHLHVTAGPEAAIAHGLNHVAGTKVDGQKLTMWWRTTYGFTKSSGKWLITTRTVRCHSTWRPDRHCWNSSLNASLRGASSADPCGWCRRPWLGCRRSSVVRARFWWGARLGSRPQICREKAGRRA